MPFKLDEIDVALLESLIKDGRKSFRAISREIKVSTPTVKARYDRLVKIGLIKAVRPEIDLSRLDRGRKSTLFSEQKLSELQEQKKHFHVKLGNLRVTMRCE